MTQNKENINLKNLNLEEVIQNGQFPEVLSGLGRKILSDLKEVTNNCKNLSQNLNNELPSMFKNFIAQFSRIKSQIDSTITNDENLEQKIMFLKHIQTQFLSS